MCGVQFDVPKSMIASDDAFGDAAKVEVFSLP